MTENLSPSALEGLRIIDLSRVLGGPFCTQMLADHGAEVIKIEPPQGDETRDWGPPFEGDYSAYFAGANRNKRSLALDLSRPEGREVLLRLLAEADILVENFKTGTMEKWGLGFAETLHPAFPRLIHCRVTGFGADGPFGGFPGYDAMIQAWSGLVSINGQADQSPVRVGVPLVDICTGMNAAFAILAAVVERYKSGRGQSIEVALYDTAITLLHPHAANWLMAGVAPQRRGNAHANIVPYDSFPTCNHDLAIGAGNDGQFRKLCQLLGLTEMADDPRFKTNKDRAANRTILTDTLRQHLADKDGLALADQLMRAGVPAGAVLEVPDVLQHPQTRARNMVVEKDGYRGTGIPAKLSRTPGRVRQKPPGFNQSGKQILADAGFSNPEIDQLYAQNIVAADRKRAKGD